MRLKAAIAGILSVAGVMAVLVDATGLGEAQGTGAHVRSLRAAYTRVHVSAGTATAGKGIHIKYVYGYKTVQPGQAFRAPLTCPRKYPHPIGGGFDSDSSKAFMVTNLPYPPDVSAKAAREWSIGVTNMDAVPANVTAIVVCAR